MVCKKQHLFLFLKKILNYVYTMRKMKKLKRIISNGIFYQIYVLLTLYRSSYCNTLTCRFWGTSQIKLHERNCSVCCKRESPSNYKVHPTTPVSRPHLIYILRYGWETTISSRWDNLFPKLVRFTFQLRPSGSGARVEFWGSLNVTQAPSTGGPS